MFQSMERIYSYIDEHVRDEIKNGNYSHIDDQFFCVNVNTINEYGYQSDALAGTGLQSMGHYSQECFQSLNEKKDRIALLIQSICYTYVCTIYISLYNI